MEWVFVGIGIWFLLIIFLRIVNWLWQIGAWFPKTTRELRNENISKINKENEKLDRYYYEMEKRSSGVFKK